MADPIIPLSATLNGTMVQGANNQIQAILSGVANKVTFVLGFIITGLGATAATIVSATLTGIRTDGGDLIYPISVPAGVTIPIQPISIWFPMPLPNAKVATDTILTVPAFGAGNTFTSVTLVGYKV